uniref:Leucine-rich repeat-containing N-terminal plant-type domain-containing protein n=1 Tax=Gossypium raimondii TaxID=29730 RepID=A0A0D2VE42_GOSRA|nr:hypothetical protein B456_010G228500 [Gossypium raimondii]
MESKWLAMVLVVLSLGSGLCDGCLEEERFALFQLKPFFAFIDYKFQDLDYESKPEKESSSNCCEWERVECNPISGRVTHLFLNYSSNMKRDWYLNASLFLPFEKLQNLSFKLSSKLDKLENLDLSDNHFNNSILASLSELSSLKSLNLAYNVFTRSNPTNGIEMLSKLNNLETLDLSYNSFGNIDGFATMTPVCIEYCGLKGTLDIQEKEGMKFNKLEVLSLNGNLLNNSLFSSLVEFSNLKSLDLSDNQLEGAIYTKGGFNSNETQIM